MSSAKCQVLGNGKSNNNNIYRGETGNITIKWPIMTNFQMNVNVQRVERGNDRERERVNYVPLNVIISTRKMTASMSSWTTSAMLQLLLLQLLLLLLLLLMPVFCHTLQLLLPLLLLPLCPRLHRFHLMWPVLMMLNCQSGSCANPPRNQEKSNLSQSI